MNQILGMHKFSAEQIADTINSIWVGEFGHLKRNEFVCGILNIGNRLELANQGLMEISGPILIEVFCGTKQKAEDVIKIITERGFCELVSCAYESPEIKDGYIVFIRKDKK